MRKIISKTPKEVIIIITVFGWLSKIITVSKYYNLKKCVEQNYRVYPTDKLDTANFYATSQLSKFGLKFLLTQSKLLQREDKQQQNKRKIKK